MAIVDNPPAWIELQEDNKPEIVARNWVFDNFHKFPEIASVCMGRFGPWHLHYYVALDMCAHQELRAQQQRKLFNER